ncbi:MAG: hypothetical protein P9X26_08715 [Candidatus Stygibacter frigidus]|nr:hypothetical protein [Candidatus Stygibacter frigidus]
MMGFKILMAKAKVLKQPSEKAAQEYSRKKDVMADQVAQILEDRPDLEKLIGANNVSMMKDNAHNMARFMESIFVKHDAAVLVQTVLWVFRAYLSHGFQLTFWSAHLNTWMEILEKEMSPETYKELYPFYFWMQVNIPVFTKLAGEIDE